MRAKAGAYGGGTPSLTEAGGRKPLPSPTATSKLPDARALQAVARPSTAKSGVRLESSRRENTDQKVKRLIKATPTRAPAVPRAAAVNRSLDAALEAAAGPCPSSSLTPIPREKPLVEFTPASAPVTPTVQEGLLF